MLRLAIVFLVIALIAGALGLFGTASISATIAWWLFAIFLILFVVSLVFGGLRQPPV
jgi:uncharacterized membrane protein YtjA (UPF0391 family)